MCIASVLVIIARSAIMQKKRRAKRKKNRESMPLMPNADVSGDHYGNALHWSQLHLSRSHAHNPPQRTRVAVLMTGRLLVDSETHLQTILNASKESDIFCCTYSTYRELALRFTDNILIADISSSKVEGGVRVSSQWQWLLLQKSLRHWRSQLLEKGTYQTIVRFRPDIFIPAGFFFSDCIGQSHPRTGHGIVYAQSDSFFYAQPKIFYGVFESMYNLSLHLYYHHNLPRERLSTLPDFVGLVASLGGLRPLCLGPSLFSPRPRLTELRAGQQPTVLFKETAPGTAGTAGSGHRQLAGFIRPGGMARENLPPGVHRRFCGCKFGLLAPERPDRVS